MIKLRQGHISNTTRAFLIIGACLLASMMAGLQPRAEAQSPGGGWQPGPTYPIGTDGASCVEYDGYLYCIGGLSSCTSQGCFGTSQAYFAQILADGSVGTWRNTTSFPEAILSPMCTVVSAEIYCLGGRVTAPTGNQTLMAQAPLSSTGIGAWKWSFATNYPIYSYYVDCLGYESTIYCVGGDTKSSNYYGSPNVYYSQITNGSLGQWATTTPLPVGVANTACVAFDSAIFCVGGNTPLYPSMYVWYAPILATGALGGWQETDNFPVPIWGASCVLIGSGDYCVGGVDNTAHFSYAAYVATLSSSGPSSWTPLQGLPTRSCAASSDSIYCLYLSPSSNSTTYANPYPIYYAKADTLSAGNSISTTTTATETTPTTTSTSPSSFSPEPVIVTLALSSAVAALFTYTDHRRKVPLLDKMRGSRWLKWLTPGLVFSSGTVLILSSLSIPSFGLNFDVVTFVAGAFAWMWIGWLPLFAYAGLSGARTSRKLGWIVKVWIRSFLTAIIFIIIAVLVDFALLVTYTGSSASLSPSSPALLAFDAAFLIGFSSAGAFLSLFPSGIPDLLLVVISVSAAFAVPAAIRRWKLGNLEAPSTAPASVPVAPTNDSTKVRCADCGAANQQGMKFCGNCGKPLIGNSQSS